MSESSELPDRIELEIIPIPPDTLASAKAELLPLIQDLLRREGYGDLLDKGEIEVDKPPTFPTDQVVTILVDLSQHIAIHLAIEVVKDLLVSYLTKKYEVKTEIKKRPKTGRR
jgi:hypothetical protein